MKYTFKITDLVIDTPETSYVRIEYMSEGRQTIPFQTTVPKLRPGLEQQDLEDFAKSNALNAISVWRREELQFAQKESYAASLSSIDSNSITIQAEIEAEVIEPSENSQLMVDVLIQQRNSMLYETDYVVAEDSPPATQEMLDYRQALRDITNQSGWPTDVIWPEKPYIPSQEELNQDINYFRSTAKVSMRQARLALIQQGLLDQVNAVIASLPEPEKSIVETEWEYAATVERKSPWIATLAPALNMTEEQMDDLFKLAATL